jgi:asparagine synthetase B (glutamine-hydrolysing)
VDALDPLELATGFLFGSEPAQPRPGPPAADPRVALEAAIRPWLLGSPCLIAFSGGRDSSALLAVAVALARREQLPRPIAVTLEFPGESTHERDWQERVLRHLKVDDWLRLSQTDELDLVGETAGRGLLAHGLLYPANTHFVVPLARAGAGGNLLTGVCGDDVFGSWPWNDVAGLFAGRRRPLARDLKRVAHWLAPERARTEMVRRRDPLCTLPWLRPRARPVASSRIAHELSAAPRTWDARMRWTGRSRMWRVTIRSMARLGAEEGAAVSAPFMDPAFLDALARAGGRWGWGNRTATMRALFGDLLPDEVLSRTTKAEFSQPLFGAATRRFAREWDGRSGIDPAIVDEQALRATWTAPQPHFLSSMLLQSAWLASNRPANPQ